MSVRSLTLSTLSALLVLAVGCARNDAAVQSGTLDVSVASSSDSIRNAVGEGSVTITGLDSALHASVVLPASSPRSSVEVSLPPGLYGVQWQPSPLSADGAEPLAAESTLGVVVVAAGSTSSVVLRAVPTQDTSSALFAGNERVEERLAMR